MLADRPDAVAVAPDRVQRVLAAARLGLPALSVVVQDGPARADGPGLVARASPDVIEREGGVRRRARPHAAVPVDRATARADAPDVIVGAAPDTAQIDA